MSGGNEPRLREATVADARAVAALVNQAYRVEAFFKVGDRTDVNDILARMRAGRFLLLEDAAGLAGCVHVVIGEDTGYFGMLSVDPRQQGRGLGTRLAGIAEDLCRLAGCREMEIEVVNLRVELPPYYRKLGYVERDTRPFPDSERATRPCHFIVMRKPL